jgi:hypothetical protein
MKDFPSRGEFWQEMKKAWTPKYRVLMALTIATVVVFFWALFNVRHWWPHP